MPEPSPPDQATPPTASTDADEEPGAGLAIRDIVLRLQTPVTNPVSRARAWVEQEVPLEQRGPGWDRHWRELEAYCERPGNWPITPK